MSDRIAIASELANVTYLSYRMKERMDINVTGVECDEALLQSGLHFQILFRSPFNNTAALHCLYYAASSTLDYHLSYVTSGFHVAQI